MTWTRRWPMKVGRNAPCPCGSGLKVKRCCAAEPELKVTTPRAQLARLQLEAVRVVGPLGRERFGELYDEVVYLPELDLSLQVHLPRVLTPTIDQAIEACSTHDDDGFDIAVRAVADELDTVERRLELAAALLALRDRGLVPPALAAVGIIDLNQRESALLISSVAEAIAVASGDESTPSGLLIATG